MERRGGAGGLRHRAAVTFFVVSIVLGVLAVSTAIPSPPTAALSVDDRTPFVGEGVRFDASASRGHDEGNGRIVAYRFDFGDGTGTDWQPAPTADHVYDRADVFEATVRVRDARGLEGRASAEVEVRRVPPPSGDAPDLAPVRIGVDPARPAVDEVVRLAVTLANLGATTAETALVRFTDARPAGGDVDLGAVDLPAAMAPGALLVVFSPAFLAVEPGAHTVTVLIEAVSPVEVIRGNNALSEALEVRPVGSTGDDVGPTGADPLPLVRGLAAAAVLSVAAALLILRWPRRAPSREPPPPEPADRSPPPVWPP